MASRMSRRRRHSRPVEQDAAVSTQLGNNYSGASGSLETLGYNEISFDEPQEKSSLSIQK
ncbi:MAG: hypothetical protein AAF669_08590 [Pseudomonadota bacterium]